LSGITILVLLIILYVFKRMFFNIKQSILELLEISFKVEVEI